MVIELPELNDEAEGEARSPSPAVARARGLLKPPVAPSASVWALFAAVAAFTGSALALAFAVVWGPL